MLDADIGSSTRADIFQHRHPERYLQMGIAEQNMLGVAAGLATTGLMPFVSTFVAFAVVRPLRPDPRPDRPDRPERQDLRRLRRALHGGDRQDPPDRGRRLDHAGDAGHGHRLSRR